MNESDAAERVDWWSLTDEQLFAQCAFDRYRARGPGGQKRNKTDSAVRLRHLPTGLIVTAADSRSQHLNRSKALKRLRNALAFECRQAVTTTGLPDTLRRHIVANRLAVRVRDPDYPAVYAWILDALDFYQGRIADCADRLGVSTGHLIRFLAESPEGWQAVNRIRQHHALHPLRPSD
jgi:hypothetical protein